MFDQSVQCEEGFHALYCYTYLSNIAHAYTSSMNSKSDLNISKPDLTSILSKVEELENSMLKLSSTSYKVTNEEREQLLRAHHAVISSKAYSASFKWVPEDYYTFPLLERMKILGAQSTYQLCKTMLMENKAYDPVLSKSCDESGLYDLSFSKYYLVVVQYEASISNKKLQSEVRALRPVKERLDPSKFDFRVASEEDNAALTGYTHNAVTPFGMKKSDLPIIVSKGIVDSDMTQFIWMGGGHIHLKLGVAVEEFIEVTNALVLDATDPRRSNDQEMI